MHKRKHQRGLAGTTAQHAKRASALKHQVARATVHLQNALGQDNCAEAVHDLFALGVALGAEQAELSWTKRKLVVPARVQHLRDRVAHSCGAARVPAGLFGPYTMQPWGSTGLNSCQRLKLAQQAQRRAKREGMTSYAKMVARDVKALRFACKAQQGGR